jgi:hypothetical protein
MPCLVKDTCHFCPLVVVSSSFFLGKIVFGVRNSLAALASCMIPSVLELDAIQESVTGSVCLGTVSCRGFA